MFVFFSSNEDLAQGSGWRSGQGKDTALGRSLCPTTQSSRVTRNSPLPIQLEALKAAVKS